ncbi:MAG: PAS domain S-box protein [Deltaproteobacteria bacterium]|nr:PAS domain S-box protein [Deltaproteobacteria bacterium]
MGDARVITFLYGLAFFAMGTAVFARARPLRRERRARAFLWLAAFGLSHGFHEWLDLYGRVVGPHAGVRLIEATLAVLSFGCLLQFGLDLLTIESAARSRWVTHLSTLAVTGLLLALGLGLGERTLMVVGARFLAGAPGAWFAVVGLWRGRRHLFTGPGGTSRRARLIGTAMILFLGAYGLATLPGPRGDFFPANALNEVAFLQLLGVPIQVVRAILAVGVSAMALLSLDVFDRIEWQRLETQLAAATAAAERSYVSFRKMIEKSADGIGVFRDNRLVYANRAYSGLHGAADAGALLGQDLADTVHPDDRHHLDLLLAPSSSPGDARASADLRLAPRDGRTLEVELSAMALDFDGAPCVLINARDLTDRKRDTARTMHVDRMIAVGTLAAGVAHEINNPLTYVASNLGYLAQHLPGLISECAASRARQVTLAGGPGTGESTKVPVGELAAAVREALDGVSRVTMIVRDLKTFSRTAPQCHGPVDVRRVLDTVVRLATAETRHRARVVKDFAVVLPPVAAEETRLGQVFLNLLVNAAQAIPEGSAETNEIRLMACPAGAGRVMVEVRDTGAGIPVETLPRIFDPFFTTKPVGQGTGLGLSICRGIVEGLGGEIVVESQVGKGSVFRVILPAGVHTAAGPVVKG